MKKTNSYLKQTNTLRQDAEEKLDNKKPANLENMQDDETKALLHELQVYQVELEMQNDELKRANAQAENTLSKYYDLAPIGYFTIDEHGKIIEVNQVGSDLLDVKTRYLINNYFQNYVAIDCLSLYNTFRLKALESKTKQNCEIKLLKKGKTQFYSLIMGIAVKSRNKNEGQMWLSVLDISDRIKAEEEKEEARKLREEENNKLLEQMRAFDRLKTEYISNLSHELRTPLNVILSSLKLLEHKKSTLLEDNSINLNKHISTVRQNCYRLLRLINNIIDITKIESGYFEIHLKNCNIISIVEEITLSVAEYIQSNGITLLFDTDVEEKLIACDPDKIERIMLNLLSNAYKYTKWGGSIFVNVFDRKETVEIVVSDTGIGIPKDKHELIFQRFRQVDPSLTKEHEGSGIGLSLVKSLIDMHEGNISVESEYGKGSKFIVRLPVKTIEHEESIDKTKNSSTKQTQIERLNIEFSDIYSLRHK